MIPGTQYLRAGRIAELLGIDVRTVRRRLTDRTLPSIKVGGARLVAEADLLKLLRVSNDEASVLNGLKEHLLHPDLVKVFIEEYLREYNRQASTLGAVRQNLVRDLAKVERQIGGVIEAVKAGMRSASMAAELERLEMRKEVLTQEIAQAAETPPTLHPGLAQLYRKKVADLATALNADATRVEAAEVIRSLIDEIRLIPDQGLLGIELVGALAGILALAQKRPRSGTAGAQLTMVAGAEYQRQLLVEAWA